MSSIALNPYSPGGAITSRDGAGFFGRQEIFQFVRSAIEARRRTPIILYGQRRMGKSSILRQIPNHLSPGIHCVYYDLQGKASMDLDQVLFGLAREISRELRIPKPQREEATEATFVDEFLMRAVQALDNRPERLVLLFDEFDILDERTAGEYVAGRKFINYLGALQSQQPDIGCIIVVGRKTDELSRELNSALLTGAVQERIGRLDQQHSDELVSKLAQSQDLLRFSQPALDRIYSLAAGHPFCTQLLCFTIWARSMEAGKTNVEVSVSMVEEAVMPALEYGTLGLNWIFDGLSQPAYRLFLSALAEAGDPFFDKPANFESIERVLRKRQISLDEAEFARAPNDLKRWDIVDRRGGGFHFQVPLVGVWIRKERPLEVLEREVRYSNPRAYTYYELAKEQHQAGDLDRAISDYQSALKENPVFFEAQRDLAIALTSRGTDYDVVASIEAYSRALDLDPEMPKSGLIQALLNALELPSATANELVGYYSRIKELDIDGTMKLRAQRQLKTRAWQMLDAERFRDAETLFELAEEAEPLQIARSRQRNVRIRNFVIAVIGITCIALRIALASNWPIWGKLLLLALAGVSVGELLFPVSSSNRSSDKPGMIVFRKNVAATSLRLIMGTLLGLGIGLLVSLFAEGNTAPQIVAAMTGFYSVIVIPVMRQSFAEPRNTRN